MGLSGTLKTMSLTDLLQWLSAARKTGTLTIRGGRNTKHVTMKEGRIIASASDDPTEQLGQFLLSRGKITEDQLRRALETQRTTNVLLGKILLMVGDMTEKELLSMLVQQAEEVLFSSFLWEDAHFEFLDGVLPRKMMVPLNLEVENVLMSGLTRMDEMRNIETDFGSARSVLKRTEAPLPDGIDLDRSLAGVIIRQIDGRRSIAEICPIVHASRFAVSKVLHQLYRRGCLELARRVPAAPHRGSGPPSPTLPPEVLAANGQERLDAGDPEAAVDLLQRALSGAPCDLEIKKLYAKACAAFREKVHASELPPDRAPVVVRSLDDLKDQNLTPEEVFLLSRINGSWDLESIVAISPLDEVDALRLMKRLKDRGIIEIR